MLVSVVPWKLVYQLDGKELAKVIGIY